MKNMVQFQIESAENLLQLQNMPVQLCYIGTYEEPSDVPNGQTIEITAEAKDLYITNAEGKTRLLYFHEEKPWFGFNNSSSLIMFDGEENNTLRLVHGRKKIAVYSRRISK